MGRASDPLEEKNDKKYKASLRAAENLLKKLGTRLEQLDRWVDDPPDGETYISEIRLKVDAGYDGTVAGIIKATIGGQKVIAFHSDETVTEVVTGIVSRLGNGSLKWREDVPYDQRNA